jgi:hypothetical protein
VEGLSEEMVLGGYACSTTVGEQAFAPPVHQRQTGRAADDTVIGRSGQAGS